MICPACGSERPECPVIEYHETAYRDTVLQYAIRECGDCRSQFADPMRPAPPEWYDDNNEYYGWRWEFDRFLDDVADLRRNHDLFTILEVGCGEGIVLDRLRSRTENVIGLEFNRTAAQTGAAKGLKILEMPLEDFTARHPGQTFNAVAFFQVLEHVEDPRAFLGIIRQLLGQASHIFFSIPNPDRYQLRIYRESWDYPPHHLSRFTKGGLQRLLNRAGFDTLKIIPRPMDRESRRIVIKSFYKRLPLPRFLKSIVKLPLRLALSPAGWYYWATSEGQDLYVMARPK